jgi:hypothetical protein
MKNKTWLKLSVLFFIFSILACNITIGNNSYSSTSIQGSGSVVEETRQISNVSSVELAMTGTLHLTIGSAESLQIKAEDNLMQYIQTVVSSGTLVIETQNGINLRPTRPIDYYLTLSKLDSITISSSGDIETGDLVAGAFSISISSSGDLNISSLDCDSLRVQTSSSGNTDIGQLNTASINVTISSSGNVTIQSGQVPAQDIRISSSGEYRANAVQSNSAEINISSSGNATVRVTDQISGRLSSSGNIYYIGSPAVNVSATSSGKPIQVNP